MIAPPRTDVHEATDLVWRVIKKKVVENLDSFHGQKQDVDAVMTALCDFISQMHLLATTSLLHVHSYGGSISPDVGSAYMLNLGSHALLFFLYRATDAAVKHGFDHNETRSCTFPVLQFSMNFPSPYYYAKPLFANEYIPPELMK